VPKISLSALGMRKVPRSQDQVEICPQIAKLMAEDDRVPEKERKIFAQALEEASDQVPARDSSVRPAEPARQELNVGGICLNCRKHHTGCKCQPAPAQELNSQGICLTCTKHYTGCRCTPLKTKPPAEEPESRKEDLGEFTQFFNGKQKGRSSGDFGSAPSVRSSSSRQSPKINPKKTSLGMMAVGALKIEAMSPEERKWPSPLGIREGYIPPVSFLSDVPKDIDGSCLLVTCRLFHAERGRFAGLLDLGAQVPVVLSGKLPEEAWLFKVKVDGRLYGFAGDTEATYLVPVSVALGTSRTHGLWFWAIPMEKLPHDGVDVVIDYVTCTALLENLDFHDPTKVKINTRSRDGLEAQVKFFKENDMKGTLTECVPRRYALASIDSLE
jgi:hypothetical protein